MNDPVKVDEGNSYNERSLKTLIRSIRLSQGQFSLILVRCNYKRLQQQMVQQLREQSSIEIQEIALSPFVKTLYTTLQVKTRSWSSGSSSSTAALSIFGLEDVVAIDELLTSTNQVRDEFRKNWSFPLVLWITDEVATKLIHLAPDFKSWAAATIKFEQSTSQLIDFLKKQADTIFAQAAKSIASSERPSSQPGELWNLEQRQNQRASHLLSPLNDAEFDVAIAGSRQQELKSAWKDLRSRGQTLEPCLEASLQFVLGRDSYASDQIDTAIEHYQQSLGLWQQALKQRGISDEASGPKHSSWHSSGARRNRASAAHLRERIKLHSPPPTSEPESAEVGSGLTAYAPLPTHQIRPRQAIVFFQMALCYRLQAARNPVSTPNLQQAKSCLEQSQALFEQACRPDLLAGTVTHLGEVLQRLEAWEELQTLAKKSLELHFTYGTPCQLAHDYGFLAEVALHRNRWGEAHQLAQLALEILKLDRADPASKSLYLLLLAQSLRQMGQLTPALDYLKLAQAHSNVKYDPRLYIDILVELRSLYFERGEYLTAFRIQKKQLEIEHQYRFRAFIGAQGLQPKQQALNPDVPLNRTATEASAEEMMVSRQEDIKRLLERMSRDDHKLTIVHGRSGVGKSSLVNAGLVPALKHFTAGARQTLPAVVRIYTDWAAELEKGLIQGLGHSTWGDRTADSPELATASTTDCCQTDSIIGLLRLAADRNLLAVLIFDQFEEFFFATNTWAERQPFYDLLQACLNLPYVKILLSLREDYLHYLLEFDFLAQHSLSTGNRLSSLDAVNNILDKQIRYQLRDFSVRDAINVIRCLTERAQFYLESALIEAVVADLAGDLQEVRPIELQVVGAQLQEEGITTAAQYQQLGANPKTELIKRSLERVISDCGPENEDAAWKVLFSLTDERGVRLSKTQHELALAIGQQPETKNYRPCTLTAPKKKPALIRLWPQPKKTKNSKQQVENSLDLILEILVGHGLAFLVRETPEDRYQLVHDYLVGPIRQRFGLEARLYQAEADKKMSQEQLYRANRILRKLLALSVVGVMLLMSSTIAAVDFWWRTVAQKHLVVAQRQRADIHTLTAASEALFLSHQQFDALMESLRAGRQWRQLKQSGATSDETEVLIAAALQQAVYGVKERNRLEGHGDVVWGVSFSPDGSTIASASVDKTVKLWRPNGTQLATLHGHSDSVASVSWSADSKILASGSLDKTVKLWRSDGKLLATLTGHGDRVTSVSFSPNGSMLASASKDKTVKLWNRQGALVRTLVNQASVNWVSFSPDGSTIATATDGGTVELWRTDGRLLGILTHSDRHHPSKIYTVCFSPNGELLATGGADNQVKLWSLSALKDAMAAKSGTAAKNSSFRFNREWDSLSAAAAFKQGVHLLQTLNGHSKWILSASFSPDGKTLASTSADNTVKLWDVSRLYGDEQLLASEVTGGATLLETLAGHGDQVTQVSWSSDGKTLASSSYDKTVRIWNLNEVRIKMLEGHRDKVLGVNFSPEGGKLASASADKTVKLWSRSGLLLATLAGHAQRVTSVSFSPDGQLLASGSYDKTVKLWSLGTVRRPEKTGGHLSKDSLALKRELTLRGHADSVMSVSFSPDGRLIASGSKDKTVKLWSREGKLIETLKGHTGWVNSVSFNPDGRLLASASDDGTVKLWNLSSAYAQISSGPARVLRSDDFLLKTINAHKNFVLGVSFSPDGRLIASASYDNTLKLWSLTPLDRLDFKSEMTALMDFNVRLDQPSDFKFTNDSSGESRGKRDGNLLATLLKGASDSVTSVSFSPDGQLIASASYDNTVKLWNRQGVLLRTLRGHRDSVMGVSFSPDGKVLASASRDKTVILWNLDLDDLLVRGCDWVSDYLKANPNVSDRDRHLCDGVLKPGGSYLQEGEKRLSLPSPSSSVGVK